MSSGQSLTFGISQYSGGTGIDDVIKATGGALSEVLQRAFPKHIPTQIKQAEEFAANRDDLIQDIISTKMDFYPAGFGLSTTCAINDLSDKRVNNFVRALFLKHRLEKIQNELMRDQCVSDNCILTWKITDNELEYLWTLAPSSVDYTQQSGYETLKLKLEPPTIKTLKKLIDQSKSPKKDVKDAAKEALANFPDKYVAAVKAGENMVELRNEDGEYWIIATTARQYTGLASPSMSSIFPDIMLRKLMVSGDWAVAYALTKVIELVQSGEGPPDQEKRDYKILYQTPADAKALNATMKKLGQVKRLVTDHTARITYPHPDPELFDKKKFESVEQRILRWGAVIDTMMTGQGAGFAQGHLGSRRFYAQGRSKRKIVGDTIAEFLRHDSLRPVINIPKAADIAVAVNYDEQLLKDPKQVLDEDNATIDRGLMDVQTYHERRGLDTAVIRARKIEDAKEVDGDGKTIWKPLFEQKQGMLSGEETGRPEGTPTTAQPEPKSKKRPA